MDKVPLGKLSCSGTSFVIMGNNSDDFLFASLKDSHAKMGSIFKGKILLLLQQILSFLS